MSSTATTDSGGYEAGKLYRCDGSAWIKVEDSSIAKLTTSVGTLDDTIKEFYSNGYLTSSKLKGTIDALQAAMKSSNGNVLFDSDGIWLMNGTTKENTTQAVWMNERGILFGSGAASSDPSSTWSNWTTAINHAGITADALAGKTVSGLKLYGGELYMGGSGTNYALKVDSGGNLTTQGTIKATSLYINGQDVLKAVNGVTKISSDYLDLGNITLDGSTGNISMTGSISLGGNISFANAGSITWGNNTPVKYQFSVSGTSSWHDTMASTDYYRRDSLDGGTTWGSAYQFRGKDGTNGTNGSNGSDATVTRNNIVRAMNNAQTYDGLYTYTYNGSTYLGINATAIKTGTLAAIDIYGSKYYNSSGGAHLAMEGGNYGNLALYNAAGNKSFEVYDGGAGYINLNTYGYNFLTINQASNGFRVGGIFCFDSSGYNYGSTLPTIASSQAAQNTGRVFFLI